MLRTTFNQTSDRSSRIGERRPRLTIDATETVKQTQD
jgi:hypothetical protein